MKLDLRECSYKEGAYGLVVFFDDNEKAVKLFKKEHDKQHAEKVFQAEVSAYKIAKQFVELSNITPDFYGSHFVSQILDLNGSDISHEFHLEMNYVMSFEEGFFQKFATISSTSKCHLTRVFGERGVMHLIDSSVVLDERDEVSIVIDFATEEHEKWFAGYY